MWFTRHEPLFTLWPLPEKTPAVERAGGGDDYVRPLSRLDSRLKFSGHEFAGTAPCPPVIAGGFTGTANPRPAEIDMVVNVPLYRRRHWRRGYNQSDLLCRPLARWLGCRYTTSALTRVHATAVQHQLNRPAAQKNLKNAFRLEIGGLTAFHLIGRFDG